MTNPLEYRPSAAEVREAELRVYEAVANLRWISGAAHALETARDAANAAWHVEAGWKQRRADRERRAAERKERQ